MGQRLGARLGGHLQDLLLQGLHGAGGAEGAAAQGQSGHGSLGVQPLERGAPREAGGHGKCRRVAFWRALGRRPPLPLTVKSAVVASMALIWSASCPIKRERSGGGGVCEGRAGEAFVPELAWRWRVPSVHAKLASRGLGEGSAHRGGLGDDIAVEGGGEHLQRGREGSSGGGARVCGQAAAGAAAGSRQQAAAPHGACIAPRALMPLCGCAECRRVARIGSGFRCRRLVAKVDALTRSGLPLPPQHPGSCSSPCSGGPGAPGAPAEAGPQPRGGRSAGRAGGTGRASGAAGQCAACSRA